MWVLFSVNVRTAKLVVSLSQRAKERAKSSERKPIKYRMQSLGN